MEAERDARQGRTVAGVDVGGTFTDVVSIGAEGPVARKVATTPADQGAGVAAGLAAARAAPDLVAHGTTAATNAVLERRVARTALVVTSGFVDLLAIARQDRPRLYDLTAVRPAHLVPPDRVVACAERIGPGGEVLGDLTDAEVDRVVNVLAGMAPESVAICCLFSWANPDHERRLGAAIAERLQIPVTTSVDLLPEVREYERASTTVLNAALVPELRRYLAGLVDRVAPAGVTVMSSGGGTLSADVAAEAPVHTLLSGPAAGVVAAAAAASSAGHPSAVAFDMGGTSTDVCVVRHGVPDIAEAAEIGGLPFRTPAVGVHTVGAGGGSLAWIDTGGALRVGPQSAGAVPGPACYGRGGTQATVTDAHAVLGHLGDDRDLGDDGLRTDTEAAHRALAAVAGFADPEGAAAGVLTVVRATMARALRRVTTERGVDPTELALVAYGGAGPLHASALASELGCAAAVIPPVPGVLSALGLLLAPPTAEAARSVVTALDAAGTAERLAAVLEELSTRAGQVLEDQGADVVATRRAADCRYAGQSHELRIPLGDGDLTEQIIDGLAAAHRRAYGYDLRGEPVEVVTLRAVAEGDPALDAPPTGWLLPPARQHADRRIGLADGSWATAAVLDRADLDVADQVPGPAVVLQPDTTTVLEPRDTGTVDDAGNLVITRRHP